MKKIILIAAIGILANSYNTNAQENTQQKDQNKTEMQQNDKKKDSTKKMNRKKKGTDSNRKMDNYPSNKQGTSNPREQRHMDSTINNHR